MPTTIKWPIKKSAASGRSAKRKRNSFKERGKRSESWIRSPEKRRKELARK